MDSASTLAAAWARLKSRLEALEDVDLQRAILDYRAAAIDMAEENFKLREQLQAQTKRALTADDFVFERNACWRKTEDGGLEGAYCPSCLEGADRAIHLTMTSTGLRCPYCDVSISVGR
jgi:DNA-directed RNA polymerase subunit RPC12/RpoP